jgi:16S rRNA C1402 (ribose-2'-O) methylase RsmI
MIKTCENLHVEEQRQLKQLLKNLNIYKLCLMVQEENSAWDQLGCNC